jgi:hypothetical protein
MAKYSKSTQDHVEKTMRRKKKGTLKSGSGKKVKSRKQAVAIALSEAREKGYKAPKKAAKKGGAKKGAKKTSSAGKRSSAKRSAAKKNAGRKRSTAKKK